MAAIGGVALAGCTGTVDSGDETPTDTPTPAGIHSVEARHASFLNELNVENPFPEAVDEPRTTKEVTEIAGQFIVEE